MPENALRAVRPDYCVPPDQIAPLLLKLTRQEIEPPKRKGSHDNSPHRSWPFSAAAPFVCPECGGPLFPDQQGTPGQLACLVGHSFAPENLSEAHREALERALLTTMRLLQERAGIHRHLASVKYHGSNCALKERFQESAEATTKDVALLREILERI
jgi:two-component system chemotaxis response regulator CheB